MRTENEGGTVYRTDGLLNSGRINRGMAVLMNYGINTGLARKKHGMNRRSMLNAMTGVCAAVLFPWRKTDGRDTGGAAIVEKIRGSLPDPQMDQVKRIELLLLSGRQRYGGVCRRADAIACGKPLWRPFVQPHKSRSLIEIWWDEQKPDKSGLYGIGLVLVEDAVAESIDDDTLSDRLFHSFILATVSKNASRQGMLGPFKGKPVLIEKGKVIGAEFITGVLDEYDIFPNKENTG